jgi:AcrR family transcriptional regulator
MARTLDPAAHALRREAFTDAALRLIQTEGYEQMSVQDVLDELGASRGAFYHYFDSKAALLDAAIERLVDLVTEALMPVVEDPRLAAPEKLRRVFSGLARWKEDRIDLMRRLLPVWISDENALTREKWRRYASARLVPMLTPVLRQGNEEGTLSTGPAEPAAAVLLALLLAANDAACRLFVARQENTVSFQDVERTFAAYSEAAERMLGLPPGSWPALDADILQTWFG